MSVRKPIFQVENTTQLEVPVSTNTVVGYLIKYGGLLLLGIILLSYPLYKAAIAGPRRFEVVTIGEQISKPYIPHAGIINPGTMCYMISTFQCFFRIPEIRKYVLDARARRLGQDVDLDGEYPTATEYEGIQEAFAFMDRLERTMRLAEDGEWLPTAVRVLDLQARLGIESNGAQEDVPEYVPRFAEFMGFDVFAPNPLLHCMMRLTKFRRFLDERPMEQAYQQESSFIVVLSNLNLELPILSAAQIAAGSDTLENMLANYVARSEENPMKEGYLLSQQYLFDQIPRYLFLQVNRRLINVYGIARKSPARITFPEELDMDPYSVADGVNMYDLIGIVVHQGQEVENGHYCFAFKKGARWLYFDDETISDITEMGGPAIFFGGFKPEVDPRKLDEISAGGYEEVPDGEQVFSDFITEDLEPPTELGVVNKKTSSLVEDLLDKESILHDEDATGGKELADLDDQHQKKDESTDEPEAVLDDSIPEEYYSDHIKWRTATILVYKQRV